MSAWRLRLDVSGHIYLFLLMKSGCMLFGVISACNLAVLMRSVCRTAETKDGSNHAGSYVSEVSSQYGRDSYLLINPILRLGTRKGLQSKSDADQSLPLLKAHTRARCAL